MPQLPTHTNAAPVHKFIHHLLLTGKSHSGKQRVCVPYAVSMCIGRYKASRHDTFLKVFLPPF